MASMQVERWTPVEVGAWIRGLEDSVHPYAETFVERGVTGKWLLMLDAGDLETFGVWRIGHQEVILTAVDLLRRTNKSLGRETLQMLFLELGAKAKALARELDIRLRAAPPKGAPTGDKISTSTLAALDDILSSLKRVLTWINSAPFSTVPFLHDEVKPLFLAIGTFLATTGQRDSFAVDPEETIKKRCIELYATCDNVVQKPKESLLIQPAAVEVVSIRKRSADPSVKLGIVIQSSYVGVHTVGEVRPHSPAYVCRRLEESNEILQVNGQTVVGWQNSKVRDIVEEGMPSTGGILEVILTLRKAPRHYPIAVVAANGPGGLCQTRSPPPPPAGSYNLDVRYGAQFLSTNSRYNYRTEPRKKVRKDETASTGTMPNRRNSKSGSRPSRTNSNSSVGTNASNDAETTKTTANLQEPPQITIGLCVPAPAEAASHTSPEVSRNVNHENYPEQRPRAPSVKKKERKFSGEPVRNGVGGSCDGYVEPTENAVFKHKQPPMMRRATVIGVPDKATIMAAAAAAAAASIANSSQPRSLEDSSGYVPTDKPSKRMGRTSSDPTQPQDLVPPPLPPKSARVAAETRRAASDACRRKEKVEDKENVEASGRKSAQQSPQHATATRPLPLPRTKRPVPAERTSLLTRRSSEKRPKAPPLGECGRRMKSDDGPSPPPPPVPYRSPSCNLDGPHSISTERIFSNRRQGIYLSAEDEYRDGSAEKLWQESLRNSDYQNQTRVIAGSTPSLFSSPDHDARPKSATNRAYFYQQTTRQIQQQQQLLAEYEKAQAGAAGKEVGRNGRASSEPVPNPSPGHLKRAALYQPPPIRASTMKPAFEMSFDSGKTGNLPQRSASAKPVRKPPKESPVKRRSLRHSSERSDSSDHYHQSHHRRASLGRPPEVQPRKYAPGVSSRGQEGNDDTVEPPPITPRQATVEVVQPKYRPYSPAALLFSEPSTKI